jgi:FtsP/CotA-like multicopper oxidase with cupredoxin domain
MVESVRGFVSHKHGRLARAIGCCLASVAFLPVSATDQTRQPPGWDAGLKLRDAVDLNPDPHIVEVNLVARVATVEIAPSQRVEVWTYDGGLPGPLIRARVGDRLIVHFTNQLPQPTTVHWHGLRVPFRMDGVPGHSQPEVLPGQTFTYDFRVPGAGLFWYHPHVMSAAQVGFGLYGALLVEDPNDGVGVADETVLVLSDIALEDDGRTLESPESGGSAGMAFGREGNHLLVNGREGGRIAARAGVPQRWRVVNAAKSRYFEVDLGAGLPFLRIGGDGGLQEYPTKSDTLVLGPGERADVIVVPAGTPGQEIVARSLLYNRGYGSIEARRPFDDLFTIAIADLPPAQPAPLPHLRRDIQPLEAAGATPVNLELTIDQDAHGTFAYAIKANGVTLSSTKMLPAHVGETQLWTLTNKTKWSHPFHLHGFFFQRVDEAGRSVHPIAWIDTVDVPFEHSARVLVRFDERPGMWMMHCHILDHAEGGLMSMVDLR